MKLTDRIYLVGSGAVGFGMTDPFDCHVYLLDGGGELALIDVGAGMGAEAIVENVRREGFDPARIRHVVLTHAHGDHAGGAARMRGLLDSPAMYLSAETAHYIRNGDGSEELYHLKDDPRENNNLVGSPAAHHTLEALRRQTT